MQSYSILLFLPLLSVFLLIKNIYKLITSHNSHLLHKRVTRNFLRQRRFLGIWALWWTIMYNTRKKVPAGKTSSFSSWKFLKNCILNEEFRTWMTKIRTFFSKIRLLFSNFWKRAREMLHHVKLSLDIATKWFRWTVGNVSSFLH